jgi:hypothetical protein
MINSNKFLFFVDIVFDSTLTKDLPNIIIEDDLKEIDVDFAITSSPSLTLTSPPKPVNHVRYLSEMIRTTTTTMMKKKRSNQISARGLRRCREETSPGRSV